MLSRTLSLVTVGLLALPIAANAELITTDPGTGTTTTFTHTGRTVIDSGPVTLDGIRVSGDNWAYGNLGYAFNLPGGNGRWADFSYVATRTPDGSITFDLGGLVGFVGGFMNYAPRLGDPRLGDPIIEVLASDMTVLEFYDLSRSAPISTPNGVNDGAFRGIERTERDIAFFRLSGAFLAIHDLTRGNPGGVGKTLPEKAAELAVSLTGPAGNDLYQLGAKGWDTLSSIWVDGSTIAGGYFWGWGNPRAFGPGLDCSGLVMWSYNKAFGARQYQIDSNPIWYENADGQCVNNALAVPASQRKIGDLMCFDLDASQPGFDHIAMYTGGDSVANASSPSVGIVQSSAAVLEAMPGFKGYFRPTNPLVDFQVRVYSPVTLIVTDPDGFTITAETSIASEYEIRREVFRELYYSEFDVNGDGEINDVVYSPSLKSGSYIIRLSPKPDAAPTDAYTLEVVAKDLVVELAKDAIVAEIPEYGFGIRVDGEAVIEFKPVGLAFKPNDSSNTINLRSRGVVPVAVLTDRSFDATLVDPLSVRLGPGGASEAHRMGHPEDVDGDGDLDLVLHFRTKDLGLTCDDVSVTLTGTTFAGMPIEGTAIISPVGCR